VETKKEEYVRDGLGWIDDFRAPAGIVGRPFSRQLAIHALLYGHIGSVLRDLRQHSYDLEEVRGVINNLLDEAYDGSR